MWKFLLMFTVVGFQIAAIQGYSGCSHHYEPICASNGLTFYSECEMEYYNRHHGHYGNRVHKKYHGECEDEEGSEEYPPKEAYQPFIIVIPGQAEPYNPYAAMLPNGTTPYQVTVTNSTMGNGTNTTTMTNYTFTYTYSSVYAIPYQLAPNATNATTNTTSPPMAPPAAYALPASPAYPSYVPAAAPLPVVYPAAPGYPAAPAYPAPAGEPQIMTLAYEQPPPPPPVAYYEPVPLKDYGVYKGDDAMEDDAEEEGGYDK